MTSSRIKTIFFLATVAFLLWLALGAQITFAGDKPGNGPPNNRPPDNRPPDRTGQPIEIDVTAGASADAAAIAAAEAAANAASESNSAAYGGDSTSNAEGGHGYGGDGGDGGSVGNIDASSVVDASDQSVSSTEVSNEFNSESTNTNVVLVPNNNTAGCQRVYGLSFGNGEGAGALGVPYRDKSCDYEQAADDAAATGQHKIAWWWRCHKPNLRKTFKQKGDSDEMAQLKCWNSMTQMLQGDEPEPEPEPEPVPTGMIAIPEGEYEELVYLAQSTEEVEEHFEQAEARYAQQQSLLETQETEIERLKRKAAALRAEQEKDDARRAKVRKLLEEKDDGSESSDK